MSIPQTAVFYNPRHTVNRTGAPALVLLISPQSNSNPLLPTAEGVWGQRRQWRLCWKGRKAPQLNPYDAAPQRNQIVFKHNPVPGSVGRLPDQAAVLVEGEGAFQFPFLHFGAGVDLSVILVGQQLLQALEVYGFRFRIILADPLILPEQ